MDILIGNMFIKPDRLATSHTTAGKLFAKAPGIVRIPEPRTVHLRLKKNYFEPKTIMAVLRKLLG